MGGGGSIRAMQASYESNRNLLKKTNPFRERAKKLKTHSIRRKDPKHFTEAEMQQFKAKLRKRRAYNRMISMVVIVCVALLLLVLILWISGSTIF